MLCSIISVNTFCELIIDLLVEFFVVETCLPRFKSSTWYKCSHFSGFILGFDDAMLSVVGDVPVNNEVSVVTL
jgi:hypothetical protein